MSSRMVIEGLGDEVLFFFACVGLVLIGMVSWWSSNVAERPLNWMPHVHVIHTGTAHPETINANPNANPNANNDPRTENAENAGAAPTNGQAEEQRSAENEEEDEQSDEEAVDRVSIKIKFLNDTQKEVKASLAQRLGRFKRRHFATELSDNKRIRLIFNGHVLGSDHLTLNDLGLFDNCVIHCLVTAAPANPSPSNNASGRGSSESNHGVYEMEDLDLSHMAYPLLGSILLVIWYCQWMYSHFFSFTSSLSLLSLTALYLASMVNTYLH